jgi:hypothetical protein
LHDLHAQELELLEVVMEWDAPFGIMIFDHLRVVARPAAPVHTIPPTGGFYHRVTLSWGKKRRGWKPDRRGSGGKKYYL